jgi:hypothetical protein
MLHRFQCGIIVDRIAGETLKNNDIYILDPEKQSIRKPRNPDEWLTCQLVYVNNISGDIICAGSACRCWIGYLVI